MKKRIQKKTVIEIILLMVCTVAICVLGYRVAVTSYELPGRLSSVSVAAYNLNYYGYTMESVQKVSYETMKYGYMEDLLLAKMDMLDDCYDNERMEEVRAVNNLTAMSEKTADKLAYEKAKKEQEEAERQARLAADAAERAREIRVKQLMAELRGEEDGEGTTNIDTGDSSDTGSGDTASKGGKKGKPVYADTHGKSLGKFVITAYCTCKICCGVYSGGNRTASGTVPTTNRTLAVDTNEIPFGTRLVINGQVYVAEDRGGAIKGKRIDMFFYTHKEALRWGRRTMEVFLAE
ncbi:MAG: 3D domain-containing protein [Lachnospiraceae bacterium]|nr:3D domain-containing protein [Lachnospiraceae bacterium]